MSRRNTYKSGSTGYGSYGNSHSGASKIPAYSKYGGSGVSSTPTTYSRYGQPSESFSSRDKGSYSGYTSGSGYISDYGKSGNISDYGRSISGYGCGYGSDYKSGYTSDYGRSGYVSDYNKSGQSPDYGKTKYIGQSYSPYGHVADKYLSATTSRPTYGSYSRNISRDEPSYGRNTYSRGLNDSGSYKSYIPYSQSTGREAYSRVNSRDDSRPSYSRTSSRDSSIPSYSRSNSNDSTGYSRQNSRDLSQNLSTINETIVHSPSKTKNFPITKSESKAKTMKVPAEFTSDSESEEATSSDEKEFLQCRATSPSVETTTSENNSNVVSAPIKIKKPTTEKQVAIKKASVGQQVNPQDLPDPLSRPDSTKRRYSSSASRPNSLYFDRYYSKYATPTYRSYRPPNSSAVSDNMRRSSKEEKVPSSPVQTKSPPSLSARNLLNVEQDAPFARDISPNDQDRPEGQTSEENFNKDFRKSVLNMNLDDNQKQAYIRNQDQREKKDFSFNDKREDRNLSRSSSRSKCQTGVGRSSSRNDIRRNESRSNMEAVAKSGSKNRIPRRKGSREDLLDSKANDRSRSSSADLLESHVSTSSSSDDDSDERSGRNKVSNTSRPRRRRKGSKDDLLEEDKTSGFKASRDLPPVPNRKVSNESVVGDKSFFPRQKSFGDKFWPPQSEYHPEYKRQSSVSCINEKNKYGPDSTLTDANNIPHKTDDSAESEKVSSSETETSTEESEDEAKNPVVETPIDNIVSEECTAETNEESSEEEESSSSEENVAKSQLHVSGNDSLSVQKSPTVIHVKGVEKREEMQNSQQPVDSRVNESLPEESSESEEESSTEEAKTSEDDKENKDKQLPFSPNESMTEKFTFKPVTGVNKEPSQRDSGFSEITPSCESPHENAVTTSEYSPKLLEKDIQKQTSNSEEQSTSGESEEETSGSETEDPEKIINSSKTTKSYPSSKFIGDCKDIDSLLSDVKGEEPETFEEFESKLERENIIDVTSPTSDEEGEENDSNTKQQDSRMEAREKLVLFIGQCQDIDEMLGSPSPVSPLVQQGTSSSRDLFSTASNERKTTQSVKQNQIHQTSKNETEEESEESSEEESENSPLEEVEPSAVRVHESKAQQPQLDSYTEEIDSSAVRIRENKPMNTELREYTEEIDSGAVRIRQPQVMQGQITNPKHKVSDHIVFHLITC
ncbi:uncharacterized protein LOC143225470 [Tachypleus tridentatus]|uniref:uncharacterized protein LOC143225470 n=1 Tax=Tachypleus tridentatus TaxID=6853 RepID=UPI003FD0057F